MARQADLFGAPPPKTTTTDEMVSLQLTLLETRPKALRLATLDLPAKTAWVPAPPVKADPEHGGFFLIPRNMAIEKGLM